MKRRNGLKKQIYVLAGMVCLGISGTASATTIGTATLANCTGGGVFFDANNITWSGPGTAPNTGCFAVGLGSTLSYSGGAIPGGGSDLGNIKDLTFSPPSSGDQFLQFLSAPSLDWILTGFAPVAPTDGTNCATLAVGHSCVAAAGSPFLLTNVGGGQTLIGWTGLGTVTDGTVDHWSLVFMTQVAESAGAIVTATAPGGPGLGPVTWSGTLTLTPTSAPVPEPASMLLLGTGLIGMGARRWRNRGQRG